MFAASPSPTMVSTKVRGRRPSTFVRRPKAASIVGDGEAANITKTYAYTYQMCPYFCILLIYMHIYIYIGRLYLNAPFLRVGAPCGASATSEKTRFGQNKEPISPIGRVGRLHRSLLDYSKGPMAFHPHSPMPLWGLTA